ncbi:MAG: DHH family phosphoesterase [Nanoarchaeota archaeon]|nr:DHH family phosphoesterase [Nanoarchaeota archaeon]
MQRLIELAKKAAEEIGKAERIEVVSHFDCDGIASAAIISRALERAGKTFSVTIAKQIKPELVEKIKEKNPELVIFTDLGSGYLEDVEKLDCKIIIADHHVIKKDAQRKDIIHINPELFGIKTLSGACVTYVLARELSQKNKDLAVIAVVGAIGDMQEYEYGINPEIVSEAEEFGLKKEKGLRLYGRTRPIHKTLEYSDIPSVSSESSAIQFLSNIGIKLKNGSAWRTLNDLTKEEMQILSDRLIMEAIKNGKNAGDIFNDLYLHNGADLREFATMLNACGRMERHEIGIGLCLGDEKARKESASVIGEYRKQIASALGWAGKNGDMIVRKERASFIMAGKNVNENVIGTITSILVKSEINGKILVGMAEGEDGIKVSARTSDGTDLNAAVSAAAAEAGGFGGGHARAAGGTIPFGSEEKFIRAFCGEIDGTKKA